ncbi:MAG: MlaD family protein [Chlamydiales bacterium]
MEDKYKAFWLGIFIIGGITVISLFILFLKPSVGDGGLILKVRFSNIDKIQRGTRVTLAGKPIGEVVDIKEVEDPQQSPADAFGNLYIFELSLQVDSALRVYSYDEIMFSTSGLLGEKSITILPKATPIGALPAQDVTQEMLFANSTDQLEQTLNQIGYLTHKLTNTVEKMDLFISDNKEDFNLALHAFSDAAKEVKKFIAHANQKNLVDSMYLGIESAIRTLDRTNQLIKEVQENNLIQYLQSNLHDLHLIINRIGNGEGTLGQLIHNNSLYLQISAMIAKVNTFLNDINNYGLLFQYDKSWQRSRTNKINRMNQLRRPKDFYDYFEREIDEISVSLNRVGQIIELMEDRTIPMRSECFANSFLELQGRIEYLRDSIKLYTEILLEDGCKKSCTD